ncbi:Phosphotransferase enzyme family protein [Legionella maceachernii]|uniref:Phosphotransferase enzyme family protein n=2 Tax=Legionellaceae TaxID=444 RepID=A0A0W0W3Y4_9GAMM|nr:aminoglycoside phosphotransferase family protein [Legionella maceachernii]KTD27168.1 Phosphotransferase enzyme family protein [Legionella maceachernii]SKA13662.1 Phosphotransferase enzyme family protein [Legionella maceachernii]SUP04804.1 Predicted phosphotransferase related to Ser/Thr protein kinases [Legionella maceachernii]
MTLPYIHWAIKILDDLGYCVDHPIPEKILETAWSHVCRFQTNRGFIYLKKVPQALSLEVNVIKLLKEQFQANVPHVLAHNREDHCFLMQDAGVSLHGFFKQGFKTQVFIDAIQQYTALQFMAVNKINLFFSLGVPDWRLEKLPTLYQELIAEEQLLIEEGLTVDELKILQSLKKKLLSICDQLAQYKIPDTFGHGDFHDKNILVNPYTHQTTLIDLGEVVITHPFFSFVDCLHRVTENLSLTASQHRQLQEKSFKNWLSLESPSHLFEIIALIQQCWPIHAVLGEYRLLKSIDPAASLQLRGKGRLAKKLKIWIGQSAVSK